LISNSLLAKNYSNGANILKCDSIKGRVCCEIPYDNLLLMGQVNKFAEVAYQILEPSDRGLNNVESSDIIRAIN